jgi:hypothetical protein
MTVVQVVGFAGDAHAQPTPSTTPVSDDSSEPSRGDGTQAPAEGSEVLGSGAAGAPGVGTGSAGRSAPSAATSVSGPGALSRTGFDALTLILAALPLIAFGSAIVLAARRRSGAP